MYVYIHMCVSWLMVDCGLWMVDHISLSSKDTRKLKIYYAQKLIVVIYIYTYIHTYIYIYIYILLKF